MNERLWKEAFVRVEPRDDPPAVYVSLPSDIWISPELARLFAHALLEIADEVERSASEAQA